MKNMILTMAILLVICESVRAQGITRSYAYVGRTFKIDVTQPWTNTRFRIVAGYSYSLIVRGVASTNGASDWVGPAGDYEIAEAGPGFLLSGWPKMSVIGKIGSLGAAFLVGDQLNFIAHVSDTLYIGYNDLLFSDNVGYFIAFFTGDGVSDVWETNQLPVELSLEQNYPNPFNPSTTIRYGLPHRSTVQLTVYNSLGQHVATLAQGEQDAGFHEVRFDASNLSSGVYFYRIQSGTHVETKKLLFLK